MDRAANLRKFCWWLEQVEHAPLNLEEITADRVRRFLAYCREAAPEGRFGSTHPNAKRAMRPSSVATFYRDLKTFTGSCTAEELWDATPMAKVRAPKVPEAQIQPFSDAQIQALLRAAADTPSPDRNRAIILVLADAGLRAGELCSLRVCDANHVQGELVVVGKGNKRRSVYMDATARRAVKR